MIIGVPAETVSGENRVAATPETVKKLVAQGHRLYIEKNAGGKANYTDEAFTEAGGEIVSTDKAWQGDMLLKVRAPAPEELHRLQAKQILVGMLEPFNQEGLKRVADKGVTAFALESAPRITRAQSMDVLSSQANIAGYKAVLMAANRYQQFFPMLMTAAGTVKPARVVVLGVGVAGLQAIATAKRLGAVIEASDVRPGVKEQIESLGGKFIDVPYETQEEKDAAEGKGGYARAMPQSWLDRQQEEVAKRIAKANIVISTALIPGRAAPELISQAMVESMQPGSIIVDMAAGKGKPGTDGHVGGNCPLTEADTIITKHGVTLIGETNLPSLVATDASRLYARNVLDFLKLVLPKDEGLNLDTDDAIIQACLVAHDGQLTQPG